MTKLQHTRSESLSHLATEGVVTVKRLQAAGVSTSRITVRCRPGGPWRRLLPGVVLLSNGEPTRRQRLRALMARFGPDCVITGVDALRAHGADLAQPLSTQLLVRPNRRVLPDELTIMHRTTHLPEPVFVDGLPYAPITRAIVDATRREYEQEPINRLVSQCLYWGLCTVDELRAELETGNQRGTSGIRSALRTLDLSAGTYLSGLARRLLRSSPLPPASWDVTVCDARGKPIALADAWWDQVGLAWMVTPGAPGVRPDGHLAHLNLLAAGVTVVRSTYEQVAETPETIVRELVRAYATAAARDRPKVQGLRRLRADEAA
ncbi:hypothetical protein [Amycolatopsis sp. NPDC059657]|uniref:hypothetical protein n=1 Tax=Amycolatopsis sp. NPDC059657 TaxID=3346899 RepID=UPI00366C5C33